MAITELPDFTALAHLVLAQDEAAAQSSPVPTLLTFLLIGLAFYFLIIRPQKKRQTEQKKLLTTLAVGDEIITIGGFHGGIVGLDEETVDVEIAEGVIVTLARNAIARTLIEGPASDTDREDDAFDDAEFDDEDDVVDLGKRDSGTRDADDDGR